MGNLNYTIALQLARNKTKLLKLFCNQVLRSGSKVVGLVNYRSCHHRNISASSLACHTPSLVITPLSLKILPRLSLLPGLNWWWGKPHIRVSGVVFSPRFKLVSSTPTTTTTRLLLEAGQSGSEGGHQFQLMTEHTQCLQNNAQYTYGLLQASLIKPASISRSCLGLPFLSSFAGCLGWLHRRTL